MTIISKTFVQLSPYREISLPACSDGPEEKSNIIDIALGDNCIALDRPVHDVTRI